MTYNTGNAVPSRDPRDLLDNAESFDIRATSREVRSTPDRLGVPRKTWYGMEQDFAEFLAASGFESVHLVYQDGVALQVDRPTQLIDYSGSIYRVKMPASFPVVLSGAWATDSALLVQSQDQSLRQDLADSTDPAKGAGMIGRSIRTISSVAELRSTAGRFDGDTVHLVMYSSEKPVGGGVLSWKAESISPDDGGSVFAVAGRAKGRWARPDGHAEIAWYGVAAGDPIDSILPEAFQARNVVMLPSYSVLSDVGGLSIPEGCVLRGAGMSVSKIIKNFDGGSVFSDIGSMAACDNFSVDGNNKTGNCFQFMAGTYSQTFDRVGASRSHGRALLFAPDSAVGASFSGLRANTMTPGTAAIAQSGTDTSATSRQFTDCAALGGSLYDFSGMNDVYVFGGYTVGFYSDDTSSKYMISNMRVAARSGGGGRHEIRGENVTVTDCVFSGEVDCYARDSIINVISAGWNVNDYGSGNSVFTRMRSFAPVMSSSSGDFSIGNGSVKGFFSREGSKVRAVINVTFGSTTILGTGSWFISLPTTVDGVPASLSQSDIIQSGPVGATRDSGAGGEFNIIGQVESSPPRLSLMAINTTGALVGLQGPTKAWANTTKIRLSVEYLCM